MGEFAQAESLGRYLLAQNVDCLFLYPRNQKRIAQAIQENHFKGRVVTPATCVAVIEKIKPAVLIACNSKTTSYLLPRRPRFVKMIASLDSNWLFNKAVFRDTWIPPTWFDYYFVVFPRSIYQAGLQQHGGHYVISPQYRKQIKAVGFVPVAEQPSAKTIQAFRRKYRLDPNKKTILTYFGRGGTYRPIFSVYALTALQQLNKTKPLQIITIGEPPAIRLPRHVYIPWVETADFLAAVSSSDLVLLHHGMGTLAKIIRLAVPVVSFTQNFSTTDPQVPLLPFTVHDEYFEVEPFARRGACGHLTMGSQPDQVANLFQQLLFSSRARVAMQRAQRKLWENGEVAIWKTLRRYLITA